MNFTAYTNTIKNRELANSISQTATAVYGNIEQYFDYTNHINGLLLGNVQSGKTAQTLGIIAKLADEEFNIFLFLTTDNVYLQKQTYDRAVKSLTTFDIIGENDDVKFLTSKNAKPILIVLKKNTSVLRKWRGLLSSSGYCVANPIVIVDDEADAASLNTLVNKSLISTINQHLSSIKNLASSSIYFQVTATPQSLLLQSQVSGWQPAFVNYFEPGEGYIGGTFVYAEPISYCIKYTKEDELDEVKQESEFIPQGLRDSLMSFLVVCGYFEENQIDTCNFLIHPSVKINDHNTFAKRIGEHLNFLLEEVTENSFEENLRHAWLDLQTTKPDITNFEDIKKQVISLLSEHRIKLIVLNSKTPVEIEYNKGFNIVVGGNSLGRGITLSKLQTVYYCRKSKTPQADTFWQHSRMFGYDRDKGLMRIYTPPSLHRLFTELNNSNQVLIKQIQEFGLDGIQLIYPQGIRPTRKNVIDNDYLNFVTGGVNFFPNNPIEINTEKVDELLSEYTIERETEITTFDYIQQIINLVGSKEIEDWDAEKFIKCVQSLSVKRPTTKCYLIIRRNRDISKGTGTLLSPADRRIGDKFDKALVLTLYRVNGQTSKGWGGKPFWIPNIKFPNDACFYDVKE
ncbi:MAG: Z1 domain-containing protein [Dysgonamonadaceae bacterium]|jgi:hypothetical protein|nr:Z1 domain-containing protein [Dysgonamonadaceae bacterium]